MTTEVSITEKGPDAVTPQAESTLVVEAVTQSAEAIVVAEQASETAKETSAEIEAVAAQVAEVQSWQDRIETEQRRTAETVALLMESNQAMASTLQTIAAALTPLQTSPPSEAVGDPLNPEQQADLTETHPEPEHQPEPEKPARHQHHWI